MNEGAATVSRITTTFLPGKPWFFVAGLALVLLAGAVLLWATFGWSWFLATLLLYGIIFSWVIARFPTPLPIGGLFAWLVFQGVYFCCCGRLPTRHLSAMMWQSEKEPTGRGTAAG